jgi:hypothetical protein
LPTNVAEECDMFIEVDQISRVEACAFRKKRHEADALIPADKAAFISRLLSFLVDFG